MRLEQVWLTARWPGLPPLCVQNYSITSSRCCSLRSSRLVDSSIVSIGIYSCAAAYKAPIRSISVILALVNIRQNYKLTYNCIFILTNLYRIPKSIIQTIIPTITTHFICGPNSPNVSLYIPTCGICPNCSMSTILTTHLWQLLYCS